MSYLRYAVFVLLILIYGCSAKTATNGNSIDRGTDGEFVGVMFNTYYYFVDELSYGGARDTVLYDDSCRPMAEVSKAFSDELCVEGSGILEDGRIINIASDCGCGSVCPSLGVKRCYAAIDRKVYPWGMGSMSNALVPLRDWAVDNKVIPHGTVLYAEGWDGVYIPRVGDLGGFRHDGCFRAADVGTGIDGYHYDFFAGSVDMWRALEGIYPTFTNSSVYSNAYKCTYLSPGNESNS